MVFDCDLYYGYIIKGDLLSAITYIKQFPEKCALYNRFVSVFEHEQYISYEVDAELNEILLAYQQYYRNVFYLCIAKEQAENKLKERLAKLLGATNEHIELCDLEQKHLIDLFESHGFYFLGGKTSGYYGSYIWRTTETVSYDVELPDGVQSYSVKLLDGFIARSWIDYLSFGEIGAGGWTDDDGYINCVKSAWDIESESFRVSLLKHEAQHARDLKMDKNMSSEDLEYRAKLVELIYSNERNLLQSFALEADPTDKSNGHAMAAHRILKGFADMLRIDEVTPERIQLEQIQDIARRLFENSMRYLLKIQYENLTIRQAVAADAKQLSAWWNDGAVMAHAGFPGGLGITEEEVIGGLGNGRMVIEESDRLIGECNYRKVADGVAEIGIKICETDCQNRGVGRKVLSMLIGWLFRNDYSKIVLDTNLTNTRAQHIYESLGFRKVRTNIDSWKDQLGRLQSSVDYELVEKDFVSYISDTLQIEEALRLRRFDGNYDFAFEWYQDPETVLLVDGKAEPYSYETLTNMYDYLDGKGELYFIEVNENGKWKPIGDVTFWQEDMPIVIGECEYRGKGIGKKVVSALVERGRAMGYDKLYVGEIYDFNVGSRKCFESVGFRSYEKTEKGSRYVLELKK